MVKYKRRGEWGSSMSTLKKVLFGFLIFIGLGIIVIAILAFSFVQAMKADPEEEKKVR